MDLFSSLSESWRLERIRALVDVPDIQGSMLRRLAATLDGKQEAADAMMAIARILSPAEIELILEDCLTGREYPARCLTALAPFLSAAQVERALDGIGGAFSDRDSAFEQLVVRLAELGEPDAAIARIAQASDLSEAQHITILTSLALKVPDNRLAAIGPVARPYSVASQAVRARGALVPWLTDSVAGTIVKAAAALDGDFNRVTVLSEMLPNLSAREGVVAAEALIVAMPALLENPRLREFNLVRKSLRGISKLLVESYSTGLADRATSLACHERLWPSSQFTLLLELASSIGAHTSEVLKRAIGLAKGQPELASRFKELLSVGARPRARPFA